jgi:SNF2 family DNA or RNA helicase
MLFKPHNYQLHTIDHIIDNPASGIFLDMGLGKSVSTLTAIKKLMFEDLEVEKVLVIAPKKVAESTWVDEVEKWDHLKGLKISIVLGTERQRIEALRVKADIYTINRENVAWLVTYLGGAWPFDMVVIDELSSFKNPKSIRFKALRTVRPLFKRVVGLTGTPAPNGLLDLWPQLYLLDQGQRLGKTITSYRDKYFNPGKRNGRVIFNYNLKTDENSELLGTGVYEKEIYDKIGDICISMKAKDYLDLPECIERINAITLPDKIMQQYLEFEKKLILSLESAEEISALNAAGLTNKLLQFTNGAVYDGERNVHEIHTEKLEALEEDMEAANGNPVLVFYQYKHDLERILKHFKAYKPQVLKGDAEIKLWNQKKIPMLLAHAASAGHGLNLQDGGNLIEWFGVGWGLELDQQAIARLHRQGQTKPVINSRIIAKGTIDEEVLSALDRKATVQDAIMDAVKARVKKYRN